MPESRPLVQNHVFPEVRVKPGRRQQSSGLLTASLTAFLSCALLLAPVAAQDHERAPVPGAADPNVTKARIHDTICHRGYTAQVRPPRKVTDAIKRRLADGLADSPHDYELDHLIPLGLGGHPTSSDNLWLQNWPDAAVKDREELRLHREV
jgi:hypothetical protein